MKFNELTVSRNKRTNRVGRGIAAGQGKTAGRGTKGQGARKSGGVRPGFEGGQTPLAMRIPKLRGFTSKRVGVQEVYTSQLEKLGLKNVDTIVLAEKGLVTSAYNPVKLLFDGEVTKPMVVKLQSASTAAKATLQKAGGSFERNQRLKHSAATKENK
jgi:large subunit ribosomal protein L15